MSGAKFTDEFKRDAVAQVEDRGYPAREVAERLGVSTKSIYTWQKQFSRPAKVTQEIDAQADEIRRLKRDLARVTEERDILKNRHGLQPACARHKQPVLSLPAQGSCRSLIGGSDPVKKRGTWADAHLRVVTPPTR